jgi:hypothetical protein
MSGKSPEAKSRFRQIWFRRSILEDKTSSDKRAGKPRLCRFRKMTARPGKSLEPKSRSKQIGVSPFNTRRETLPVKSGAVKLKPLRF